MILRRLPYARISAFNNNISISDGIGLYSKINLGSNDSSKTLINFDKAVLQLISKNKLMKFGNVSNIYIENFPVSMYIRQPTVFAQGHFILKNFYFGQFVTTSQDTVINGDISFDIFMSDYYTFVQNLLLHGQLKDYMDVDRYNNLNFLLKPFVPTNLEQISIFVWILLLLPLLLAIVFIRYLRN